MIGFAGEDLTSQHRAVVPNDEDSTAPTPPKSLSLKKKRRKSTNGQGNAFLGPATLVPNTEGRERPNSGARQKLTRQQIDHAPAN